MIAGPYLVSWQQGVAQMGCPAEGPRPVNLNFTQMGNQLSVLLGGEDLRGTLFDTYDFSLAGGRGQVAYSLRGRAVTGGPTSTVDGGMAQGTVRLVGSLSSNSSAGAITCDLTERYTGDRL
jgi:hypothetical protein